MFMATNIMVVDNHDDIRRLFMAWLEGEGDLHVVGGARDAAEAIKTLAQTPADVVLLDLDMPDPAAVAAIRAVKAAYPDIHVVGMSWDHSSAQVARMLDAGACCMFNKADKLEGLIRVVDACFE